MRTFNDVLDALRRSRSGLAGGAAQVDRDVARESADLLAMAARKPAAAAPARGGRVRAAAPVQAGRARPAC